MKQRTHVFLMLFCLLYCAGCKSNKQLRQDAADEIGPANLKLEMSLGELKQVLRESNPQMSPTSFSNETILEFRHGLVQAHFVSGFGSESLPKDNWQADRIEAYAPFKGTVAGMSIRTSYEAAIENVKKFYPNATIYSNSYGGGIKLKRTPDDTWSVNRCQTDLDGEKIGGVCVYSGVARVPIFPSN